MDFCGITDRGLSRKDNQDAFIIRSDDNKRYYAMVVCDGMGGANAGSVASKLCAETFFQELDGRFDKDISLDCLKNAMLDAVEAANTKTFNMGIADDKYSGMGTTLVGAAVLKDEALIINIGDSRAYKIWDSNIVQITKDHSVVEEMLGRGDITLQEAVHHPQKHLITRAVGTSSKICPDTFSVSVKSGEYIFLCTDGLSNTVSKEEILSAVINNFTVEEACNELLKLSLSRGAPDNVTAVLCRIV